MRHGHGDRDAVGDNDGSNGSGGGGDGGGSDGSGCDDGGKVAEADMAEVVIASSHPHGRRPWRAETV